MCDDNNAHLLTTMHLPPNVAWHWGTVPVLPGVKAGFVCTIIIKLPEPIKDKVSRCCPRWEEVQRAEYQVNHIHVVIHRLNDQERCYLPRVRNGYSRHRHRLSSAAATIRILVIEYPTTAHQAHERVQRVCPEVPACLEWREGLPTQGYI